ncbi:MULTISPECIES: hypothetical protein [unclassified Streptomyces]|uniref:hypothetical protein n=1 Tax=unclassified Streptomyces TaxID=2593676 RepID=UPI001162E53A|nr:MULTISPECIES: hypothetical protein [unclassified Streptomyces]QDN60112.1 hypothetical protein FNV67_36875 [Streptomyces sp. S1D4-20]
MTTLETLAQEYTRLTDERGELAAALRKAGDASPESRARLASVDRRLRDLVAAPPPGYILPKAAADLVAHAQAHGWLTLVQWTPPGYGGEPFVSVQVGRLLHAGEQSGARGDRWTYNVTWHSRDCAPGRVRLFGRHLATTPEQPWLHDGPSVKAICAVIAQHPAPRDGGAP